MSRLITDPVLAVAVGVLGGVLVAVVLCKACQVVTRWAYTPRETQTEDHRRYLNDYADPADSSPKVKR